MNIRGERLPFEPLEAAVRQHADNLGLALGISSSSVRKYRERGLSWLRADELANRAGYCPMELWPFEWCDVPFDDIDDDQPDPEQMEAA